MSVDTKLDANQVLQGSYDEANNRIRVVAGVILTDSADSIKLGDGAGNFVGVTSNALNVNVTGGGGGGGTQYADGATQATPTGTVALGKNASNVLHSLSLDNSGNLNVNLASGSISGGNAAASPTAAAVPASADYLGYNSGGNLVGVSTANALPVAQQGNITINALTNTSIVKAQLQDNAGTAVTVGQKAMASSLPVVLSSDQTAIPVSQNGTWNITNVSGTVSLPTGAATGTKQDTGNTSLASIDTKTPALGQALAASSVPVVLTAAQLTTLTPLTSITTVGTITNVVHVDDNAGSLTVDNGGTFAVQATVAASATNIAKAEDVASADADVGVPAMAVRKATPANTSGTDGDYEMLQMSAGRLWTSSTIDSAIPAGTNVIGHVIVDSGAVNATLAAETTKVIGTVNIAAAQTIAVTESGTWTVQPGNTANTTPWLVKPHDGTNAGTIKAASTAAAATDTALVVAVSPNNTIAVTESGTWTVQPGNTANTTPWLTTARVVGNTGVVLDSADNATTPANAILTSGLYNTTIPALTSGNAAAVRTDSTGAIYSNIEGRKQTFSVAVLDFATLASSTAPSFSITGSGTKTIRIVRIGLSATAATGGVASIILRRFSALSGGTAASQAASIGKHDTNNASATAVVNTWSVVATTATSAGILRTLRFEYDTPAVTIQPQLYEWTFGDKNSQALVLRGTSDFAGLCFSAIATTPTTELYIEWTEE
jgi:hypothetical protein